MVLFLVKSLLIVLMVLLSVAFLTAAERKVMSSMQQRKGPNVVGFLGLLQPIADGLKLFAKETVIPSSSNPVNFALAPILTFFLSLLSWVVIPVNVGFSVSDLNLGLIYLFAVSSLGVYGIILAGWSSNSKYAFLGALRSAAQMISYEVSMGLILITVLLCAGSLNLSYICVSQKAVWFFVPLLPLAVLFLVSILAETNRAPFDLPEAEAELVSGYNVEYSAFGFALFFLGEYANMILMSSLTVVFFFGGWFGFSFILPLNHAFLLSGGSFDTLFFVLSYFSQSLFFSLKICLVLFFFIWVRASFPRYRYDQLMRLGWKIFLPLSLAFVVFVAGLLKSVSALPII
uniref:NADH-ubiquinone oxidoreductase chain 1 n=1 Tax=Diacronema viridis TaxID=2793420 RepID=A0A7T1W6B5_9EUKA|nr:NADH dehydrogenase subunit 1 [Diacronema viridis]QPO84610.1 NADH dehydrogenase subunit 1 [Diacronema viridis]QPO84630.1 NADH dehydrogenase subunit 1 [Diacronema viridis]